MLRRRTVAVLCLALLAGGCSYIPWHPFNLGNPVAQAEAAGKKEQAAERQLFFSAQELVHKADYALSKKPPGDLVVDVARAQLRVAEQALDQALGQPKLSEESKWTDLVDRLTSDNAKVRARAAEDNADALSRIEKLSQKLQDAEQAKTRADDRALKTAAELQSLKDNVLKWAWGIGALFLLYFLGQILQFIASFNPAFETASNLVNTFVSPALHAAAHKARRAASAAVSAAKS